MRTPKSFIFVIFGGSGDLAARKLIPALYQLFQAGRLPEQFAILGLGRKKFNDLSYRGLMHEKLQRSPESGGNTAKPDAFMKHLYYQVFDITRADAYPVLKSHLESLDQVHHIGGNYLYYLAIPPELFVPVAVSLSQVGLQEEEPSSGWRRIILEKPFGRNLESAKTLNRELLTIFKEDQIYRIDHYLGKETVQNVFALRFANGLFESVWNREHIHHIEITSAESIGVEKRGAYYENAGALRDMIQNHLLQLVATIAMEPPYQFEPDAIRDEKVKVFKSLRPINSATIRKCVVRGQYISSTIRGESVPAYREEAHVDPQSLTETFVAIRVNVDNYRWAGVPIYIRTGKRLPTRATEVVIHFRKAPQQLFKEQANSNANDNQLVIRIQPDAGILLKFGLKIPGAGYNLKNVGMDFHYSDLTEIQLPEAYERLLLDALSGDSTLYARADGVEAAWEWVDDIIATWTNNPDFRLYGYPAGTWGPPEATALFDSTAEDWRYPCKNLTGEDTFCEL